MTMAFAGLKKQINKANQVSLNNSIVLFFFLFDFCVPLRKRTQPRRSNLQICLMKFTGKVELSDRLFEIGFFARILDVDTVIC